MLNFMTICSNYGIYPYVSTNNSDILKRKGNLKIIRYIIVNNKVIHTITSGNMNLVQ